MRPNEWFRLSKCCPSVCRLFDWESREEGARSVLRASKRMQSDKSKSATRVLQSLRFNLEQATKEEEGREGQSACNGDHAIEALTTKRVID